MAKVATVRTSEEGADALRRLQRNWGYETQSEALDASLVCWEWALAHAAETVSSRFTRDEWNLIADVCNGTGWAYGNMGSRPGMMIAAEVSDGHHLNGTGYLWLCESDNTDSAQRAACDDAVRDLIRRLAALEYAESWAVIRAVCWFWQHDDIDFQVDEWWKIAFRRDHANRQVAKESE